jgi:two-component system chemotaxis sensor kinase CheA
MEYNPVQTFLTEADELISNIEQSALSLGDNESGAEAVNQLFRAFHTIKGSGAMCGLLEVSGFTHHVETLLDKVREGTVAVSPELSDLVLAAADQIKLLLAIEHGGKPVAPESNRRILERIAELSNAPVSPELPPSRAEECEAESKIRTWEIRFRPDPSLLACGGNPVLLFRDLRKLGQCDIVGHTDGVPALNRLQPELCYFWWTLTLQTAAGENAIRDVFLFVEDGSNLEVEMLRELPLDPITRAEPRDAPANSTAKSPVGEDNSGGEGLRKALVKESTVRVPAGRLDRLVNLVGELLMNQSRLSQAASQVGAPELANPVQEMERLVAELREDVLGIRMLPIGTIFGRFRRLVHDLSTELGKEADLITEGAETELDKSILDQLGEPLVHLLRNSMDHGFGRPEDRVACGKPRRGVIRLMAEHAGSDIVITIEDDGRGIDRAAVRQKAIEKQLITPAATLNDKEILNLVLLPGFSTAPKVTSVSGRGVGMDVVKKQIEALRGSLSITSEEGKGCRVAITLPLTLAIIEGLLVQVGVDQFIIPMAAITENVELLSAERARNNGRNLIAVRGELVPYIDLRQTFRLGSDVPAIEKVVIVRHEDHRVGLVVDRVLGTHQTVIQSLGKFFKNVSVVSGATIMGDGRVALIMDIAAVVRHAQAQCCEPASGDRASQEWVSPTENYYKKQEGKK